MGYLVGRHGWGDALLTKQEVERNTNYIKSENSLNGVFLWSWQKSNDNVTPTVKEVIDLCNSIMGSTSTPSTPETNKPSSCTIFCPKCKQQITISLS